VLIHSTFKTKKSQCAESKMS